MMLQTWPFTETENTACFTQSHIIEQGAPILLVTHDADDGSWQFLDGSDNVRLVDALVVSLREIWDRDPSLAEVADLPLGCMAWREEPGAPWERGLNEEDEDDEDEEEAGGEA